ncbi:Type IV leader peptidase family protein [Nocardioides dokdonensis FR1436]|uniref:Type IV leader peptidase family protein n=1 Tax=Nocardioides dokdonensis FR1436 TaxID=1300347 RepID=A0A1A9GP73_9ACTN|nr:A24 family peptidase [Nocardioides dokdonensis]ANH39403.1 Type IV leader peptidase family protein [Nocardioides dokdonensis FR1436]
MTLLLAVLLAAAAGALAPLAVRRLPEPDPTADRPADEPAPPSYAAVAARPGLGVALAVVSAAVVAASGVLLGTGWVLAYVVVATPVCACLAYVDARTRLLPKRLVLPATGLLLALALGEWVVTGDHTDVLRAGLGLLILRSVYWGLWFVHSAGMGFGDVRLAALLGLVLGRAGASELLVGAYTAFLVFVLPALVVALVRWDRSRLRTAHPFGPAMIVGALIGLLAGPEILGGLAGG